MTLGEGSATFEQKLRLLQILLGNALILAVIGAVYLADLLPNVKHVKAETRGFVLLLAAGLLVRGLSLVQVKAQARTLVFDFLCERCFVLGQAPFATRLFVGPYLVESAE